MSKHKNLLGPNGPTKYISFTKMISVKSWKFNTGLENIFNKGPL